MIAQLRACDAPHIEAFHESFSLAGLGGQDVFRARQVVEHFGCQAEGGHSDSEAVAELAEGVGKGFILDGSGIEEFPTLAPCAHAEGLEELFPE